MHLAHCNFKLSPSNAAMIIADARHGRVEQFPPRSAVAIVGAGAGREEAPYNDPQWEIWGLNAVPPLDSMNRIRADRWFELHEMSAQSEDDMAWIRSCPFPIYLVPQAADQILDARERGPIEHDIPMAVRYPIEAIEQRYGSYFTCTFAYQMALAAYEGFTDVGLFGVELSLGTRRERTVEWACVSWWMGFLEGQGVRVHLSSQSLLGRHPFRYGIEYEQEKHYVERMVAKNAEFDILRDAQDEERGAGG